MVNCICDQIQSENICRNINHGNKLPNMHGTYQIHNLSINARLKAAKKKKKIAQSKCRMLHVLHELRKQRARTPLLFKLTLRSRSHYHELNLSCHELSVVFGLSTLNSNQTIVSRGDWLGNPANIKVENNGAVGYVGSSLTVHNPLFSVHKL